MPTLDWIGKKAVINHHREVPFHLLRCNQALSVGDVGSGNLLIQGDNLIALKSLLPYYARKVKCIYIDPPYNTGEEGWVYNDNVTNPEIVRWLGKLVGPEAEDLSRHDKWLCMMYPRLSLLREFLSEDGVIFVSIDDNEIARLRLLLNEIFGEMNFLCTIIWQKRTSPDARLPLGTAHDYIVAFANDLAKAKSTLRRLPPSSDRLRAYKNPDNDPRGAWASVDITGQTGHATPEQFYKITTPSGRVIEPPPGRCWAMAQSTFLELARDNRIWFGLKGESRPRLKKFLAESEGVTSWTWWPHNEVGHNQEATKELHETLGEAGTFDNPKPARLIARILRLATGPDSLVLDSFAGSGTTGQAVMEINAEDGGRRRFILIEMDKEISEKVTARRLANAGQRIKGSQGFRYCSLGTVLFESGGSVNPAIKFVELAAHIYFAETGEPIPHRPVKNSPLIGVHSGVAIYLLFNGILGDKSLRGGNVLTSSLLACLPRHEGPKVIYGEGCRLGAARLRREGVTFRQIPYDIKVS